MAKAKKRRRYRKPGRFWLWLYHPAGRGAAVEQALVPWARWGSVTGSGSGGGTSDISWEHATLAGAKSKARKMHALLGRAGVMHTIKIVDTGPDGVDHHMVFKVPTRRRLSTRRRTIKKRRTSRR